MTPENASALICSNAEAGLIDLREAGQFGEGHALFAVPVPFSRLEIEIGRLVPRTDAKLILIDAGDGIAARASLRLTAMGYTDLAIVDGGMPAWAAAGLPVFKGVNVPSKTLGELAEAVWHPAMAQAEDVKGWGASGRLFRLFDARPAAEYAKMRIPGAACLPNGELAHRLGALPEGNGAAPLVITCAGRTRGIVGAIGLRLAGYEGELRVLENGTQGWALAGGQLERGNTADPFPEMGPRGLAWSRAAADSLMARFALPEIDSAAYARLAADSQRTTYLFDTRSADEARADPVAAAVHAPSGQIVQATDQWIGLRHARVILCCDTGLRSALAAFWLRQMGHDAHVLRIDDALRTMPAPRRPSADLPEGQEISATAGLKRLQQGALLLDLRASAVFRQGHVAGAVWTRRPLVPALLAERQPHDILLIADDGGEAALAAADLHGMGIASVALVAGGAEGMLKAGALREITPADPPDDARIDHLFFVHDRHDGNLEASRRYLEWETGLVGQLSPDERAQFQLFAPTA